MSSLLHLLIGARASPLCSLVPRAKRPTTTLFSCSFGFQSAQSASLPPLGIVVPGKEHCLYFVGPRRRPSGHVPAIICASPVAARDPMKSWQPCCARPTRPLPPALNGRLLGHQYCKCIIEAMQPRSKISQTVIRRAAWLAQLAAPCEPLGGSTFFNGRMLLSGTRSALAVCWRSSIPSHWTIKLEGGRELCACRQSLRFQARLNPSSMCPKLVWTLFFSPTKGHSTNGEQLQI